MTPRDPTPGDPHEALGAFIALTLGDPPTETAEHAALADDPHTHLGVFVARQMGAAPRPAKPRAEMNGAATQSPGIRGWLWGRPGAVALTIAAALVVFWLRPAALPMEAPPPSVAHTETPSPSGPADPTPSTSTAQLAVNEISTPTPSAPSTAPEPLTGPARLGGADIVPLEDAVVYLLAHRVDGATLRLARGALTFAIDRPHSGDWTIHAGPYAVRVVGTAFRLAWSPAGETLTLDVHRGRVEVVDTRAANRRTHVGGGSALHLSRGQGWPIISMVGKSGSAPTVALLPPQTSRSQRPTGMAEERRARRPRRGSNAGPRPRSVGASKRRSAPSRTSDGVTAAGHTSPAPPALEKSPDAKPPQEPPKAADTTTPPSTEPQNKVQAPERKDPAPTQVARLEPLPPSALRVSRRPSSAPQDAESAFFRVALGLTEGAGAGDRPLEVRFGALGQLSPRWALGVSGQLWTRASDPASKCTLVGACGAEEDTKADYTDLHARQTMAVLTTTQFNAWKTQWATLALEADVGLAIERWDTTGTAYVVVDDKKEGRPYTAETWLTGTQLAFRPILKVPLGTPRVALTLSGETAGRFGMAIRAATSSGPATAVSPPLDELQWGGHLGLEAAF